MRKIPDKLVLGFLIKIIEDTIDSDVLNDITMLSSQIYENTYDYIFVITLRLLKKTYPICEKRQEGISYNIDCMDLAKTIQYNTLADRKVYSKEYKLSWLCNEHKMFLFLLNFCYNKTSKCVKSSKVLNKYILELEESFNFSIKDSYLDFDTVTSLLKYNYSATDDCLMPSSILNKNNNIYLPLCKLLNIIINMIFTERSNTGSTDLITKKVDYFIVQQYGVRQTWNTINKIKILNGIKHRRFQETIFSGNSSDMNVDALYLFDKEYTHRSFLVDVKFYSKRILNKNGVYDCIEVRNQLFTYSSEFARYVTEYTKSNKKYHANDFTNWILHFRCDANDDELKFNGVILDSYDKSVGIYVINLRPDYTIKDIDFQIENFVMNYVLKNL